MKMPEPRIKLTARANVLMKPNSRRRKFRLGGLEPGVWGPDICDDASA